MHQFIEEFGNLLEQRSLLYRGIPLSNYMYKSPTKLTVASYLYDNF